MLKDIPISIYRGGTSKGIFIDEKELPKDTEKRNKILLKLMGSPDERQIDGLGGAVSTTSKVALISTELENNWDINYTFAQVSVDKPVVSYSGNCGNISSAVGVYALENGLVEIMSPITTVRVYNTNTKKIIYEHIPTPNGKIVYSGDFEISGVPGTGNKIELEFLNPGGSFTGKLLPTGNTTDILEVEGVGEIKVSIVDAANPLVYVYANDIGFTGIESSSEIDSTSENLELLEKIRGEAAVKMGLISHWTEGATITPGVPKLTIIHEPMNYITDSGTEIDKSMYNLSVRMMSMQKAHKSIALTGALCTAAASAISGTIPFEYLSRTNLDNEIVLGHSAGLITVSLKSHQEGGETIIDSVSSHRTARKIMTGLAWYGEEND